MCVSELEKLSHIHNINYSERYQMNSQTLIKFMSRLIKNSDKKILLILDNLKVHHSHMVNDWLKDHKTQIEVFRLPAYSPEPYVHFFWEGSH